MPSDAVQLSGSYLSNPRGSLHPEIISVPIGVE